MTRHGHGGPRTPGPGKRLVRPPVTEPKPPKEYDRSPVEPPASDREEAALEWWRSLEPWRRLAAIVKLYFS